MPVKGIKCQSNAKLGDCLSNLFKKLKSRHNTVCSHVVRIVFEAGMTEEVFDCQSHILSWDANVDKESRICVSKY